MTKQFRFIINASLLISTLAFLAGCAELFKGKGTCPTCAPEVERAAPEDVLLSIGGKPAVTKQSLEDFYTTWIGSSPEAQYAAAFDPEIKTKAFKELEMLKVLDASVKKDGKDQTPEYKKQLNNTIMLAMGAVNFGIYRDQVLNSIDTSDAALEKFYEENRGKNRAFDNPPFLKSPESIKLSGVEFSDEKSAKDFLAKAQKPGASLASLASTIKKSVKDYGTVSPQSREVDFMLAQKARTITPGSVELVKLQSGKFAVVKAGATRVPAQYLDWKAIAENPQLKETVANIKKQTEFQPAFMKFIEDKKKELDVTENNTYLEDEAAKKKADFEAKIKEFQEAAAKEEKEAAPAEEKPKASKPKSM